MLKRTLAQLQLQQARSTDSGELSLCIVIPSLMPVVERSYLSGLACIFQHSVGENVGRCETGVFGTLVSSTGTVDAGPDACGDANKRPSFVFLRVVSRKRVLRVLLRAVKQCSVGPWPIVPLLKRTTAWTCLVERSRVLHGNVAPPERNLGGSFATAEAKISQCWTLGSPAFCLWSRLWRPSTVFWFPLFFTVFQCSIRDTILALPENVCRVWR